MKLSYGPSDDCFVSVLISLYIRFIYADILRIWSGSNSERFSCTSSCCEDVQRQESCSEGFNFKLNIKYGSLVLPRGKFYDCFLLWESNFYLLINLNHSGSAHSHDRYCSCGSCHRGINCERPSLVVSFFWLQVHLL